MPPLTLHAQLALIEQRAREVTVFPSGPPDAGHHARVQERRANAQIQREALREIRNAEDIVQDADLCTRLLSAGPHPRPSSAEAGLAMALSTHEGKLLHNPTWTLRGVDAHYQGFTPMNGSISQPAAGSLDPRAPPSTVARSKAPSAREPCQQSPPTPEATRTSTERRCSPSTATEPAPPAPSSQLPILKSDTPPSAQPPATRFAKTEPSIIFDQHLRRAEASSEEPAPEPPRPGELADRDWEVARVVKKDILGRYRIRWETTREPVDMLHRYALNEHWSI